VVITVFRNRLRPENVADYQAWIARMSALAKTMPGYISHKAFTAEDGERVTDRRVRERGRAARLGAQPRAHGRADAKGARTSIRNIASRCAT
jgi:uncharacterized protein (DUF885 family)